ncbi:hypothetical protein PAEPH01_1704 [Pancytospora epiphaga]|nr:hypothetical protein PAEPH01_1704 [Pancytospora epiphaga]
MFWAEVDDSTEYNKVEVDNRVFYSKKIENAPKKRRYSDLFKDPAYKINDIYRKLKMIKKFTENNDLDELTEKYKEIIVECAVILNREFGVSMDEIYEHYKLEQFGIFKDGET